MKNPIKILLFLILCNFCCQAQSGWTNYNTSNSPLISNSVSSVALDHDDNLWGAYAGAGGLGDGVFKFDGKSWVHYNTSNSGLPNDDVRDIAVDLQGNIWFACYNAGVVKFNGVTWTRYNTSNSGIAGNDVVDIEFGSNGNVWFGNYFSGVSKFNGVQWTIYNKNNAPFPDNNCISDLTIDKNNNVWVGMDCAGGMAKFSSNLGTWTSYRTSNSSIPDHTVRSLMADGSGTIWASHINVNVSSLNGTSWTTYDVPSEIDKFTLDDQEGLLGCGYGLFKFGEGKWNKMDLPLAADTTYAFGVEASAVDNIWLSTYSGLWYSKKNTPPVFNVATIATEQDFKTFKVQIEPVVVPKFERWQKVSYSLVNLNEKIINATIDSVTGEITLTSIAGAFGEAALQIIANDGQVENNLHEVLVSINVKQINTPPVFKVAAIIAEQDFKTFKVQVEPAAVPESEQWQKVSYSLVNLDEKIITAAIDPTNGEITLTSVVGAYGEASLRITANDGQTENNVYETLVTVTIKQNLVTGLEYYAIDEIQFFPNPVSTVLSWNIPASSGFQGVAVMHDMMGREVRRFVLTMNDSDLSSLAAGVYLLRLVQGNSISKTYKIVKR